MTTDIEGPIQDPANGHAPTEAVIFLHGYGADGNDLIGLAPFFAKLLPGAMFLSPHAPEPCELSPFGRQWFSLADYDPTEAIRDPQRRSPIFQKMLERARAVAPVLDAYIDSVMATYDLPADKVSLVGFSQGTMMALHVALRRPAPMAAVLGFSGALVGGDTLAEEITARPPIMLIHGDQDDVVPFTALAAAEAALTAAGVTVRTATRHGLSHGIDTEGVVLGSHFLAERLN